VGVGRDGGGLNPEFRKLNCYISVVSAFQA
jgi:hypothetical protein